MKPIQSVDEICKRFECTPAQVKVMYSKNAAMFREMAAHPKRSNGARWQGYTAPELADKAEQYDGISAAI